MDGDAQTTKTMLRMDKNRINFYTIVVMNGNGNG